MTACNCNSHPAYLAKASKDADKGSKEDFQQEKLALCHGVIAWLDEQRGCQESQVGDLKGSGVQVEPVSVCQLQLPLHACLQALLPAQPIPGHTNRSLSHSNLADRVVAQLYSVAATSVSL